MQAPHAHRMRLDLERHPSGQRRSGFTLVELLIVISIIALLAGLLLVAVGNAFKAGRTAEAVSEIKGLEAAINAFEAKYGPMPSSIIIHEAAADWTTPPTNATVTSSFAGGGYDSAASGFTTGSISTLGNIFETWRLAGPIDTDINGDGDTTDTFILNGAECLPFFLGGHVTQSSTGEPVHYGLNFKSATPFDPPGPAAVGLTKLFEFKSERLDDYDGDGFFEYRDPTGLEDAAPYQYFRAGPLGYNQTSTELTLAGADGAYGTIDDETMTIPGTPATPIGPLVPYFRTDSGATATPVTNPTGIPFKEKSFQIIAAGPDGQFGDGGEWSSESGVAGRSLAYPTSHPSSGSGPRQINLERDNIANFSGGTLN